MDWGTVSAIGALVAVCFGYLSRQIQRVDDKLTGRMDRLEERLGGQISQLTERYIAHLERHPR